MQSNKNFIRVVALTAIVVIGGGALIYSLMSKTDSTTAVTTAQTTSPLPTSSTGTAPATSDAPGQTTPAPATSTYKDGTYTVTGNYISPGGDEKFGLSVTLQDDIITATSFTPEPVSPEGTEFQGKFAANYKALVIGKDISSVHLTEVSGSSLTPGGFDTALAQIEQQAKA